MQLEQLFVRLLYIFIDYNFKLYKVETIWRIPKTLS